jgi:alpha-L-rhamnosidase
MTPPKNAAESIFRNSLWIWPESPHWDMRNCYAQFRHSFRLAAVPRRAPLFITADQSYQLYLNGRFVCRGPARGFQSHWPYDEVNVAPFLRRGRNVLAVRAHNPGFSNFQYLSAGLAGLLVAARWGRFALNTAPSWKCRREPGVSKDTVPTSVQLFPQEHVDSRLQEADWAQPDFDDSAWPVVWGNGASWNAMPWSTLEPRGIPLLREETMTPRRLRGVTEGTCASGYRQTRDVVLVRSREPLAHRPLKQKWKPLRVPATGPGNFRSYLIDFECTVVGNLTVRVAGCRGGEIVDTWHVESVNPETLVPDYKIPSWSRMAFGSRLVCRPGRTEHTFYHPIGFRYLILTVRDSRAPLKIDLALNWIGYPLQGTGRLSSSDPVLKKLWDVCAWTQQCCSLDAYVDTPWREQAQWWGDARVQAWNTFYLRDDARLLRRGIGSIASQTTPSGLTYGHAPTMAHGCILPDFTLMWMLTLWDYYWQTGSLEAFESHRDVLDKALAYFEAETDSSTGLLRYDRRYWLFLDWADVWKQGFSTLYNLLYLHALQKILELEELSQNRERVAILRRKISRLSTALRKMQDPNGWLCEGLDDNHQRLKKYSVQTQTLACLTGLVSRPRRNFLIDSVLLPWVRDKKIPATTPSVYWTAYPLALLLDEGFATEVVAFIRRHWEPMIEHGTTWEQFHPKPGEESLSHAWSAHPLVHLSRALGGITQMAPAWKKILFRPAFIGKSANSTVPSPQGAIRSAWKRRDGVIHVTLSVPRGVRARIALPDRSEREVGSGQHAWSVREPA